MRETPAGLLLLVATALVAGCSEDKWEGYVHPDRNDREQYQYVGTYPSLDACRQMALAVLRFTDDPGHADYECGKNCRWQPVPGGPVKVCEATGR